MQRFRKIHCGRNVDEQRAIWAKMLVFGRLSAAEQREIRKIIGELAKSEEEEKSLLHVLTSGTTPEIESALSGVPAGTLYRLQREFYRRCRL